MDFIAAHGSGTVTEQENSKKLVDGYVYLELLFLQLIDPYFVVL